MRRKSVLALFVLTAGCGEVEITQSTSQPGPRRPAAQTVAPDDKDSDVPPPLEFQENAFVESDRSRDPFRNFAQYFVEEARGAVQSQREVVLEQYAIEDLRLAAIVQGIQPAKAMFIDPTGLGHFVSRGQYLGRAAVVQPIAGASAAYEVNWRIDRIRDGDVVLVRDDPSNPDVPSSTRVVPLNNENLSASGNESNEGQQGIEAELREMRERLEKMAAADAARKRSEGTNP